MIADDEPLIRNNMRKGIRWEEYGFQVVGCYSNGYEVLEALGTQIPDLLITNINMPYVNGIEVAKYLHMNHPQVKVVFLTGYSEFEYAKKAMEYQVSRYILKPIDSDDIYEILGEMKGLLDNESRELDNKLKMEEFYLSNQLILKNMLISQIFTGKVNGKEVRLRMGILNMEALESPMFQAATILLDLPLEEAEVRLEHSKMKAFQRMMNLLGTKGLGYVTLDSQGCNVLLCGKGCHTGHYKEEFEMFLEEFRSWVEGCEDFTVTIGVGGLCNSLELVHSSYEDAALALKYRDLVGTDRLIYLEDMEPHRDMLYSIPEKTVDQILEAVKLGNGRELEQIVEAYKNHLFETGYDIGIVRLKMLDIISRISEEVLCMGTPVDEVLYGNEMRKIINAREVKDMMDVLLPFCQNLSERLTVKRKDYYHELIEKAKELIEENYMDSQFTVEDVCEKLNLSTSYFRAVFKKETGSSFGNYLKEIRMRKAQTLIMQTNLLNYEIAEKVGYLDNGYFGYCIKKYFHVSPNEMRRGKL